MEASSRNIPAPKTKSPAVNFHRPHQGIHPDQVFLFSRGIDADKPTFSSFVFKLHLPTDAGKERVVLSKTHIGPGLDSGSTLSDQYGTTGDLLAVESLDT